MLVNTIKNNLRVPQRTAEGPFLLSYDHAFAIKGQGTIVTGTVLSGSVAPGALVDVPALGEAGRGKKVRSLQMFKRSVKYAMQGDRVALNIPQID